MTNPIRNDDDSINLRLTALEAGTLMTLTSHYSACRDFETRLAYAVTELGFLQHIHRAVIAGQTDAQIADVARKAHADINTLVAHSIKQVLNEAPSD